MNKSLAILSFNTLCSSRLCCLGLEGRQDAQVIYVICLRFSRWNNHLCSGITCGAKQLSHKSSFVILKKYFFNQQPANSLYVCILWLLFQNNANAKMLSATVLHTHTLHKQECADSLEVLCCSVGSIPHFSIWQIFFKTKWWQDALGAASIAQNWNIRIRLCASEKLLVAATVAQ